MVKGGISQYTVKPLITDPPKSRQPPYSGRLTCPRWILPYNEYITNLREADTSQLRTADTDQAPMYLGQYKTTSENGQ